MRSHSKVEVEVVRLCLLAVAGVRPNQPQEAEVHLAVERLPAAGSTGSKQRNSDIRHRQRMGLLRVGWRSTVRIVQRSLWAKRLLLLMAWPVWRHRANCSCCSDVSSCSRDAGLAHSPRKSRGWHQRRSHRCMTPFLMAADWL